MFNHILKKTLLFAVFLLVVWLVVVFYWQMTHRLPDAADVFIYFAILPLGLLLAYWVLKKFIDGIKYLLQAGGGATSGATAATANATSQVDNTDAQERSYMLELLATAVHLPQADSPASLLDLLQEPKFEPKPSTVLQTHLGSPVLCTEVEGLSVEALREELTPLTALHSPDHELLDSWLRSAILIQPILESLVKSAQEYLPVPDTGQAPPTLHVHMLLPEAWPEPQRKWMGHWLKKTVFSGTWPQAKLIVTVQPCFGRLESTAVLDQWNVYLNREQLSDLCLLAAVDSAIDSTIVQDWERQDRLFSSANRKAVVPGEGAAGVLVRRVEKLSTQTEDTPRIALYRVASGRRDQSAKAGATVSGRLLSELAQHAMRAAHVEVVSLSGIIADTDHRSQRFTEVVNAASILGELKKEDDLVCWSPGLSMGYAGAAATLAALGAAKEHVAKEKKPVLWCLTQDEFERAAVVINTMPA